jgi:hypothetical protein
MPSLTQGSSSSAATPVLDLWTAVGNPRQPIDVAVLQFRVFDTSTDSKKVNPVQVYPSSGWQDVDPTLASPGGVRLATGHYFAPWTVPLDESLGDHRIDWQFRQTTNAPWESFSEDFYVAANPDPNAVDPSLYCSVEDIRAEGFTNPTNYPDSRIISLIELASRFVETFTGRWFYPKEFNLASPPVGFPLPVALLPGNAYPVPTQTKLNTGDNPLMISGKRSRDLVDCELQVPICRLDALGLENQAFLSSQITWIELSAVRVFNRHLRGMTYPDDRENPHIGFTVAGRIVELTAAGMFPGPRLYPLGRMNVFLFGAFGYTDQDPTGRKPEGITPKLIRHLTKLLVIRDILPESQRSKKIPFREMHRIIQDREGSTSVGLQQAWVKGGITMDPDIDRLLIRFRRPASIAVA